MADYPIVKLVYRYSRSDSIPGIPKLVSLERGPSILKVSSPGCNYVDYVTSKWGILIVKDFVAGKNFSTNVILTSPYDHGFGVSEPTIPSNFFPETVSKNLGGNYFINQRSTPKDGGLWNQYSDFTLNGQGLPIFLSKAMFPGFRVYIHYLGWRQVNEYWFPTKITADVYNWWFHRTGGGSYILQSANVEMGHLDFFDDVSASQHVQDHRTAPKIYDFTFKKGTESQFWNQANMTSFATLLPPDPPAPVLEAIQTSVPYFYVVGLFFPVFGVIFSTCYLTWYAIKLSKKYRLKKNS